MKWITETKIRFFFIRLKKHGWNQMNTIFLYDILQRPSPITSFYHTENKPIVFENVLKNASAFSCAKNKFYNHNTLEISY